MTSHNEMARMAAAIQASIQMAQLAEATAPGMRYTDREMMACAVRLELVPPIKEILRQVSFSCGQHMTKFCADAVVEKIERVLAERIAAGEPAKEAA